MKPRRRGHIVNVASIAGKRISIHGAAHYTAAKAGVIALTRHLDYELGPYGIRVNARCPGETAAALIARLCDSAVPGSPPRPLPLGRVPPPQGQTRAAVMLLPDRARS